jgi:hypothetical protein
MHGDLNALAIAAGQALFMMLGLVRHVQVVFGRHLTRAARRKEGGRERGREEEERRQW